MRTKYRQVVPLLLNSPSNISVGSVTLHGTHSRPGSAQQGLAPLSAEAVCRYLSPEDVRYLGSPLAPALRERMYRVWSAGDLRHVSAWLRDDPPHNPYDLWARRPPALASSSSGDADLPGSG